MQTLTEHLLDSGLGDRILTEHQLNRIAACSAAARYGLVNRALRARELTRVQRGVYILAERYRRMPAHPFAIAQGLMPGSYVSFETALAYHGWIPEAVLVTASVTPGRKSRLVRHRELGDFTFHPLVIQPGHFLDQVERRQLAGQWALVAEPPRALLDLVCLRKEPWQGRDWLIDGLRIDPEHLCAASSGTLRALESVYRHKRARDFVRSLAEVLGHD